MNINFQPVNAPANTVDPNAIAQRMALAEALRQRSRKPRVIEHPLQGVAQLSDALVGGLVGQRAEREGASNNRLLAEALTGASAGQSLSPEKLSQIMALNPELGLKISERQHAATQSAGQREAEEVWIMSNAPDKLGAYRAGAVSAEDIYKSLNQAPADPLVINNQLVNPQDATVLGDFRNPEKPQLGTTNQREYEQAVAQGFEGSLQDWILANKKAGATNVNVGSGAPGLGKLSTDFGYVLDPETGLPVIDPETGLPSSAAIPGSPAAIKAVEEEANSLAQQAVQTASDAQGAETMLDATSSVLDIINNAGNSPVTGTLSRPLAALSNTPAGRLRSYVGTLQSGVALEAMLRLKQASSTGSTGFGAMNQKELSLLINSIGALDPDTTEPDIFKKTIERIAAQSRRVVEDIKKNVSPERIEELGLQPLIDSIKDTAELTLPEGVSEEDIQHTMQLHSVSREQVLERLNAR